MGIQGDDTVAGKGMGAQVGVLPLGAQQFLVLQKLHEFPKPYRRLARGVQEAHRRLVGGRFLSTGIFQEGSQSGLLSAQSDCRAYIRAAGDGGGASQHQG